MQGKTLLASFGVRTLEILRAVSEKRPLLDVTIHNLASIGWATKTADGEVRLTVAGIEALGMLENLDAIPEEHVDLLERLSDPYVDAAEILEPLDGGASRSNPFGSS
ncbi:TPA: hypothetical protein ACYRK3_000079 [Stenotrophomonas maltophilia]|uniref:hypothetical protein n=1 Tax=Stenotrophomonas TaxID=40323 RepID=UPI000C1624DB|nr:MULTISPECIES: hypothetical protein [Stenotrophomonas]